MKYRYATLEEIPEALRSYYKKQDDGSYVLECEGAADMKKVQEFRDTNTRLMKENDDLKKRFKDVDPDEFVRLKSIETDLQSGKLAGTKAEEILNQRTAEMKKAHDKAVAELNEKLTAANGTLSRLMINDAAVQAALPKGLRKEAAADLQARVAQVFRLVDGKPVAMNGDQKLYGKDGGELTIGEYIDGMITSAPHLFEPSAGTGAGGASNTTQSPGNNSGVNPWKKETWNMTEQGKMVKANPKQAAQMAKAAGKPVTWPVPA